MASPAAALRVVVTRRLPPAILSALTARPGLELRLHDSDEPCPRDKLLEMVGAGGGAHGLLCLLSDRVDEELLGAAHGNLRSIATMSVGYSHLAMPAVLGRRIRVGYTPGVLTNATADLVLALTLATCRRIVDAAAAVRSGEWSSWKPFWLTGKDVAGATVGIVGLGRIGEAVGQRFKGFGCKLQYTGRSGPKPEAEAALGGATWVPMEQLLATSDIVVLICALTPETRNLIGARELAMMKQGAVLINAARGEVVDQEALIAALKARPDLSAGLDVTVPEPLPTDSELLKLPNCLVLPHIGSASTSCRESMASLSVENLLAGLEGRDMPAEVPETAGAWKGWAAAGAAGNGTA